MPFKWKCTSFAAAWLAAGLIGCSSDTDESVPSHGNTVADAITHDHSTPEGAILSLEDAYRNRDVEAAVRCKDFRVEAELMLQNLKVDLATDPKILEQTAEVLELGFRSELASSGFPDFGELTSTFSSIEPYQGRDDIVQITEHCRHISGVTTTSRLAVAKTADGWKVVTVTPSLSDTDTILDTEGAFDDRAKAVDAITAIGGAIRFKEASPNKPVDSIQFRRSQVTDADLRHVKMLTTLGSIDLYHTPISDAGLAHLKGLTHLRFLNLMGTQVTGAGLVHLKRLKRLSELHLADTQVTDPGLVNLVGLNLRILGLGRTSVTDTGMIYLNRSNLVTLNLDGTAVTNSGLQHLTGMSKLQHLNLSDTRVTDAGLVHFKRLVSLRGLVLGNTPVTDAGMEHLSGLVNLRLLHIQDTKVTDAGLVHLSGLSNLGNLSLASTRVTDKGLEHLNEMGKLRFLFLSQTQVTDDGVKRLQTVLPECQIIHVR